MVNTRGRKNNYILISLIILSLSGLVSAVDPNQVIVWEHSHFYGDSYSWILEPGMRHRLVGHFPGSLNDQISSIEVGSNVKVITYRHADFAGPSKVYQGQVESLSGYWNDQISSLIIFPKAQAAPLGVIMSDTAFNTVTGYEPVHQFFPLPEDPELKSQAYADMDDYINDKVEYVLLQGDNVEVTLHRHASGNRLSDNLTLPSFSCGSPAIGTIGGYQTFRLSGCAGNLEGEVSSLEVREREPPEVQSYGTSASTGSNPQTLLETDATEAPRVMETIPNLNVQGQLLTPGIDALPLETVTRLSGRVYVGEVGVEEITMAGVVLELFCSNNDGSLGRMVGSTNTSSNGWYGLTVPPGCEFYSIRLVTPIGYSPVGASSVDGRVIDSITIQYAYPLEDQVLTGNKFWISSTSITPSQPVQPLEPSPEEPPCPDGCVCMSHEMAEQEFGRYERCTSEICGYDEYGNPMYCFRPLEGPSPEEPRCPDGCVCMSHEMAEQEFGRYERCTAIS